MLSNVEYELSSGFYRFAWANAVFSSVCALLILIFAQQLPELLNLANATSFYTLAICLILFAARLFMIVKAKRVSKLEAWCIVIGDLLWVVGSAALLSSDSSVTLIGNVVISVIALAVLSFAVGQWRGLVQ